jgi:YVTN family beta-propeller protein
MTRPLWRQAAIPLAAMACCSALASGAAQATVSHSSTSTSRTGRGANLVARPGTNLILNPGAQVGAFSAQGWDAVTIPGWQIVTGLPTVVRYGTRHFPPPTGRGPAVRSGQLFAGGAGGTARLRQVISLRSADGTGTPARAAFRLSAWLGGTRRSRALLSVTFLGAGGRVLGARTIGPVGGHTAAVLMRPRAADGTVPAGSASAVIELTLATSAKNFDGPYSPPVGYNRAVADDLRFSVSTPVHRRVLRPPAADIPRYQHVFLFYFENEDFGRVIGNTRLAPYLNSLLPHASLLADFFAEEHPSDGNYLALAGGSTFGVPLNDPLEENSQYTIRAASIANLIDSAHETWKAYLQSADGPCDDTVHGYYWDDDMPMTYFGYVRDRPAYCSAHLVPLQSLQTDLASAATTPNFAWVSPNDCADMEGCGIRDGDNFLATELTEIMRSPAWRTQRSLAIITFDEDGYDYQHPAQHVATVIIGSRGVRQGYVSHVRYTHYSLLRTIEAALGLGTLTGNDRYAQPVNDIFIGGAAANRSLSLRPRPAAAEHGPTRSRGAAAAATAGSSSHAAVTARGAPKDQTAFVVNSAANSVTPVDLVDRRAGQPIPVGSDPVAIAIAPGGGTAYVVNSRSGTVTPINTVTRRAGPAIRVGNDPQDIAIAPNGMTGYVTNAGSDSVTPINLVTGQPGTPIPVGTQPHAIAITPDGRTALVLNWGGASVTPIRLGAGRPGHRGRAGRPIPVGAYPFAVAIAPDGATAYVANYGSDTVTPIDAATLRAGPPVPAGQAPDALAVAPDGKAVYVVGGDTDTLTPVTTGRGGGALQAVKVGSSPTAVAIPGAGQTAFVVNTVSGTVTPVSLTSGHKDKPLLVGAYDYPTSIALAPSGPLAVVVDTYSGQVTLINTTTRRILRTVAVGSYPAAAAIAP